MKKTLILFLVFLLSFTFSFTVYAHETNNNHVKFLINKGVSSQNLTKLNADEIRDLVLEAQANNFTGQQIQQYISGLLTKDKPEGIFGTVLEDGRIIDNGTLMPNLLAEDPYEEMQILSFTGNYRNVTDVNDQTGTYWKVIGETSYNKATAYINLPNINAMASNDRAYMYFSGYNTTYSIVGDYGVVYMPVNGTFGWYGFSSYKVWNSSKGAYDPYWHRSQLPIPSNVTKLYLRITATDAANDTIRIEVLNGNDFSVKYYDNTVTFTNNPINSTYSNLRINHTITMAQVNNGTLNTNTGSWFQNAKLSQAYLYKPSGYWQWGTNQTNDAYIKAPTQRQLATISVNSYSKWYAEDISMRYNVP